MEQGREVFAVPGNINNPLSKGCHSLIRQGAKLVENVQDIIEEIGPLIHTTIQFQEKPAQKIPDDHVEYNEKYAQLLNFMAYDEVSVDQLIEGTGLTADVVSSMLLELELHGLVTSVPGGFYARVN